MRGAPEPGAPAPATGHPPRIPFLTAFTIDILRFEGHFCCPVWVLRRDSISAHVWYGLRTNLVHQSVRSSVRLYVGSRLDAPIALVSVDSASPKTSRRNSPRQTNMAPGIVHMCASRKAAIPHRAREIRAKGLRTRRNGQPGAKIEKTVSEERATTT